MTNKVTAKIIEKNIYLTISAQHTISQFVIHIGNAMEADDEINFISLCHSDLRFPSAKTFNSFQNKLKKTFQK